MKEEEKIPLFKTWTAWYAFVLFVLLVLILFFYWLTNYFS